MNKKNVKQLEENVHSLYTTIMDKPLQILDIFNNFFGEDKVDMQGTCEEDTLKQWLKTEPINSYFSINNLKVESDDWDKYATNSIIELPQDKFEYLLSLLFYPDTIINIAHYLFNNIFILVHFPHVRVTNENNKYVDINHLWAKIRISSKGTLKENFTLNRSEYQTIHFRSNYLHSHITSIPKDDFTRFQLPCTGSGPINNTMTSLKKSFDNTLWQLFCFELSKYVTVESIEGVPYHYLESIGSNDMSTETPHFYVYNNYSPYDVILKSEDLAEFVKYFIQNNHLKFNYKNNSYSIGMSYIEYVVLISNNFIKWYNKQFNSKKITITFEILKNKEVVRECIISNGRIYYENPIETDRDLYSYIGKKICTFKGKEITLNIIDITETTNTNKSIILNTKIALFILNQILKVLNYRYGRKTASHSEGQIGTEVRYF